MGRFRCAIAAERFHGLDGFGAFSGSQAMSSPPPARASSGTAAAVRPYSAGLIRVKQLNLEKPGRGSLHCRITRSTQRQLMPRRLTQKSSQGCAIVRKSFCSRIWNRIPASGAGQRLLRG